MSCQLYLLLVQLPSVVPYIDILCKKFPLCKTKCRPRGIRTPSIRSQTPYPSLILTSFLKNFLCVQRDSNPQSSDSKSDALSVGPCGYASCQSIVSVICSVAKYLLLVPPYIFLCVKQNCIEVRRLIRPLYGFLKSFLCKKSFLCDQGIRTPNLLIRSQTPYPLGHASFV